MPAVSFLAKCAKIAGMIAWIANLFVAESEPARPPRDLSRFDLGVCPG